MPDTWITPRVWVAGEKVTASKKNDESNNFRVLFPYTTGGDIAYRNAAGAYLSRLAIGANRTSLYSNGSSLSYQSAVRWISFYLNTDVALALGDDQASFRIPTSFNGWNVVEVAASRRSGTGLLTLQLRRVRSGVSADVLSTKLTIDSGELDSNTAATPAVINTANDDLATADSLRIDVDGAGTASLYVEAYAGVAPT